MKIKCPECDFENEEGAKFCSNCGKPFSKQKTPEEGITEQRKKEIQEEERIRANERSAVEGENTIKGCGCVIAVIIILVIIAYFWQ